jgi:ribosomal protein S18 acetylase RimI-like enzyme
MLHHDFSNTPQDFQLVWEFVSGIFNRPQWICGWDFCRLEWWYNRSHALKHREDPGFFSRNLHLWLDNEKICGLAISEDGEDDLFIITDPDFTRVIPGMLAWAEEFRFSGREKVTVIAPDGDEPLCSHLAERGYVKAGFEEYKYVFDLTGRDLEYPLDRSLGIMAANQAGFDHEARMALIKNTFPNTTLNEEKYFSTFKAPSYNPELDISIVGPGGLQVAYCMGWVNARTKQGVIEPVGVHSRYRRQGLATSVITECFIRMQDKGVKEVQIGGNNPLYDSLGTLKKNGAHKWVKPLA